MKTTLLTTGLLLGLSSAAFASGVERSGDSSDSSASSLDFPAPRLVVSNEEAMQQLGGSLDSTQDTTAARAALADEQRALQRRARRQFGVAPAVLVAGTPMLAVLAISGFPTGNCEDNKAVCSSYSPGDFSSIGDDIAAGAAFSSVTTAIAGTSLLIAMGSNNRQLSRGDFGSVAELHEARGQMLTQFGRRTKTAGAGLMIAGAAAAITGGILYATNIGDCELGDCAVVPAATKTIFTSVFISGITGGMLMGVGARSMKRGEALRGENAPSLAVTPWFSHEGGGATLAMTW